MTPTSAPSGRKLTEEQNKRLLVEAEQLWADLEGNNLGGYSGVNRPFYIKWKMEEAIEPLLRAACDAKDAEIARLEEDNEQIYQMFAAERSGMLQACEQRDRAESRLAAMATVTEADVANACKAHGVDRDGHYAMRAALEDFVTNKTAGET